MTVIRMTPRIDAGGIIDIAETPIGPDETAGELEDTSGTARCPAGGPGDRRAGGGTSPDPAAGPDQGDQGAEAPQGGWTDRLVPPRPGRPQPRPRDAALAGRIDDVLPARFSHERSGADHRAPDEIVDGHGPAGEVVEAEGDRLVVAAGEGSIRILVLQVPGKRPFTAAEFLRGHRVEVGDLMGPPPSTVQA